MIPLTLNTVFPLPNVLLYFNYKNKMKNKNDNDVSTVPTDSRQASKFLLAKFQGEN